MKRMLETCELLWDLHIKLGHRNNINAKAKTGRKKISKKNDFRFSVKLPNKLQKIHCFGGGREEKGMEERRKGKREEWKKDADASWIADFLGTKK